MYGCMSERENNICIYMVKRSLLLYFKILMFFFVCGVAVEERGKVNFIALPRELFAETR